MTHEGAPAVYVIHEVAVVRCAEPRTKHQDRTSGMPVDKSGLSDVF
jgi:hypothetical protein